MGLSLLITGIVLIIAAARGRASDLFELVQKDFTGENNFFEWMFALVLVGVLGFVPRLKTVSTGLLGLVLVAIFLKRGTGFFAQLTSAASATTATASATGTAAKDS